MAERGVTVTYESIRAWFYKFGRDYAKRIRARRGQLGDTWYLDEVYLKIDGRSIDRPRLRVPPKMRNENFSVGIKNLQ